MILSNVSWISSMVYVSSPSGVWGPENSCCREHLLSFCREHLKPVRSVRKSIFRLGLWLPAGARQAVRSRRIVAPVFNARFDHRANVNTTGSKQTWPSAADAKKDRGETGNAGLNLGWWTCNPYGIKPQPSMKLSRSGTWMWRFWPNMARIRRWHQPSPGCPIEFIRPSMLFGSLIQTMAGSSRGVYPISCWAQVEPHQK